MSGVIVKDLPEPYVFHLSEHAQSLKIQNCTLPLQTLNHLIQQINGCTALRILDLSGTNLTGCLSSFLPHSGLSELEQLALERTRLNTDDIMHLFAITKSNKLPKLRELDLSKNTLTGCLSRFLSRHHPGLSQLVYLRLDETGLNKEDLQHVSHIAYNLPKLQLLDLSHNTLTGCLRSCLPDRGLPQLKELLLHYTGLNKTDLDHVTHLIQTHKLPGLEEMDLAENRLSEMETDVEHLIEACLTHHQRELNLRLWDNGLSTYFIKEWILQCIGTNILLYTY